MIKSQKKWSWESGTCPIHSGMSKVFYLPQQRTLSTRHPLALHRMRSTGCWPVWLTLAPLYTKWLISDQVVAWWTPEPFSHGFITPMSLPRLIVGHWMPHWLVAECWIFVAEPPAALWNSLHLLLKLLKVLDISFLEKLPCCSWDFSIKIVFTHCW